MVVSATLTTSIEPQTLVKTGGTPTQKALPGHQLSLGPRKTFPRALPPSSSGPGLLAHMPQPLLAPLTSTLSRAETQASEASQMAVKSWPPSRASTTRPPASVISCLVKWPKPLGMSEGNEMVKKKKKIKRR